MGWKLTLMLLAFVPVSPAATENAAFDAVSIKVSRYYKKPSFSAKPEWGDRGPRVRLRHIALKYLLEHVFGLQDAQIEGPGWLDSEFFDIDAVAPDGATQAQTAAMFESMLKERFQLRYHFLRRQSAVYALEVRPGGAKLGAASPDETVPDDLVRVTGVGETRKLNGGINGPFGPIKLSVAGGIQTFEFARVTMAGLARFLSQSTDLPVVDATGLSGVFAVRLERASASVSPEAPEPSSAPSRDIGLDSLRRQGLSLTRRKLPVDKLVIDHIEKPSAN